MMDKAKKHLLIIGALIGIIAMISILSTCNGASNCDGKKCKATLGFKDKEKLSERDSIFRAENPLTASKFKVFVENSASMDGYVNGDTQFKEALHRLIGQVFADVLKNDTSLSLNYINSEIIEQKCTREEFTKILSPGSFSNAGGDRANSDIIEVVSKVVKETAKGEVSMFVSDCVYSPESSGNIHKMLKKQQTDMLNILKNKAKNDAKFGALLYRMISDFRGLYYTKTNDKIVCDGKRPYFVWFFGDESILANVYESISTIVNDYEAKSLIGIPTYSYLPYKTLKSDHSFHYVKAKTKSNSLYTFSFVADLSYLPLSKKYILDTNNYKCEKERYFIKNIEEYSDPRNTGYNFKYTVCIKGRKNSFVVPALIQISLKSILPNIPKWVDAYNDPYGIDYDHGYTSTKLRTFGLKSLVDGLAEFYDSPNYVTFKIQIN